MSDAELLKRLVLQHARTSQLMGVDFVPAYRLAGHTGSNGTPAEQIPQPRVHSAAQPLPQTSLRSQSHLPAPMVLLPTPTLELKPLVRTREAVQAAMDELRARYEADAPHQHFVTDHNQIVWGEGDLFARLMFVGEAPGADEDRQGVPFVGRAGQLLNKMISAMGLSRQQVYISNVLKTRPPDNATPTSEEIRLCAPYLYEQIRIVSPEVLVTLGLPATRALLGKMDSMSRLRGRWTTFTPPGPDARPIKVMPTYHPAFLLRSYTPENRRLVWSDLQQVMAELGIEQGVRPNFDGGAP